MVVGLTDDSFGSLTVEQMQKFSDHFKVPEQFVKLGDKIVAIPMISKEQQKLEDSEKKANPPENQEFQAELKIFNQSYASAEIHSDESAKVMEADTSPEEYNVKDLVTVFIFLTLFSASATAALWMLRRLFAVLTRCESPFCCEVVNRMRGFGFSLLPVAVFASIGETMLESFLTAGKSTNVSIQWGVLIAFVVTMALVAVFKYGVQLQKESDETL